MIAVEHLTKCYGDFTAVNDLSFEIGDGAVYGFLGPNGAGKSTTMNIMTGCLSATEGHILIDGHDIFEEPDKAKRLIGYLPEQPPLYMNETPLEYLKFVGQAKGLKGAALREQIETVIEQTRIGDVCHKRISALSKGYKQRVGIAQALLGNPKVIILDEPTVGLDPIQIIEIRELIKQLGKEHTVILSSHILSEVQTICEKILIIAHGELIAYNTPDALEKTFLADCGITITAETGKNEITEILKGIDAVTDISFDTGNASETSGKLNGSASSGTVMDKSATATTVSDNNTSENTKNNDPIYTTAHLSVDNNDIYNITRSIFLAFADKNIPLVELTPKKATLEDVFIELTESAKKQKSDTLSDNDSDDVSKSKLNFSKISKKHANNKSNHENQDLYKKELKSAEKEAQEK